MHLLDPKVLKVLKALRELKEGRVLRVVKEFKARKVAKEFRERQELQGTQGTQGTQGVQGSSFNRSSFTYTATANQTSFSGSDDNGNTLAYTQYNLDVFLNGTHLDPADYTATNGTAVVLASGASVGDTLTVTAFTSAGPQGTQGVQSSTRNDWYSRYSRY